MGRTKAKVVETLGVDASVQGKRSWRENPGEHQSLRDQRREREMEEEESQSCGNCVLEAKEEGGSDPVKYMPQRDPIG